MGALGDLPASKVTTLDVEGVLETVAATGASPTTVNRYREIMCAAYNFGMKSARFNLPGNPAAASYRRRVRGAKPLVYFTPDEIESVARALEDGLHREVNERHARSCRSRDGGRCTCTPTYRARGIQFTTLEAARAYNRDTREADELADDRRDAATPTQSVSPPTPTQSVSPPTPACVSVSCSAHAA